MSSLINDRWVAENLIEALHTAVAISSAYVLYLIVPILYEAWLKRDRTSWFYTMLAFCIIKLSTFIQYTPMAMLYWSELDHGALISPLITFLSVLRLSLHLIASAIIISRAWHATFGMWRFLWRWCLAMAALVIFLTIFGVPPWDPPNIWDHDVQPWEAVQ